LSRVFAKFTVFSIAGRFSRFFLSILTFFSTSFFTIFSRKVDVRHLHIGQIVTCNAVYRLLSQVGFFDQRQQQVEKTENISPWFGREHVARGCSGLKTLRRCTPPIFLWCSLDLWCSFAKRLAMWRIVCFSSQLPPFQPNATFPPTRTRERYLRLFEVSRRAIASAQRGASAVLPLHASHSQ